MKIQVEIAGSPLPMRFLYCSTERLEKVKREIIKRLISLVIILFGLSLMTFGLTYILPSNPAEQLAESMGAGHDREVIAKIEEKYGLDKSFGEQYVNWLKGALHGDFGMSVKYAQPFPRY